MKEKLRKYIEHLKYKFRCLKNAVNLWIYKNWWKIVAIVVFALIVLTNVAHKKREKEVKVYKGLIDYVDMRSQLIPQKKVRKKTNWIPLHHTASELPYNRTPEQYIKEIEAMHTNPADPNHGWSSIGYHVIICDTAIYYCQNLNKQIPGVMNHNSETINICVIGNFDKREPTQRELETIERCLRWIATAYTKPKFCFHSNLNNTKCCGAYLKKAIKPLINELNYGR